MSETFDPHTLSKDKAGRYAELKVEIASVLAGEGNLTARMATTAAMLAQAFPERIWTGFYIVDPETPRELVVGPYQGALGCLRISFDRGVCGAAAREGRTKVVADVHAFPGHIACDARARSEIVVPVRDPSGALIAVLDVDDARPGAFDDADRTALESLVALIFAQPHAS